MIFDYFIKKYTINNRKDSSANGHPEFLGALQEVVLDSLPDAVSLQRVLVQAPQYEGLR